MSCIYCKNYQIREIKNNKVNNFCSINKNYMLNLWFKENGNKTDNSSLTVLKCYDELEEIKKLR